MAEAQQSALRIALTALHSAADIVLHTVEHHITHAIGNVVAVGSEGVGIAGEAVAHWGLAEAYAVAEVLKGTYEAIESARHGDWDAFTAATSEVSNAATSAATGGLVGVVNALVDSLAAVQVAAGGHGLTHDEIEVTGLIHLQDVLIERGFSVLHPESISTDGPDAAHRSEAQHHTYAFYEAFNTHGLQHVGIEPRLNLVLPTAADVHIEAISTTHPSQHITPHIHGHVSHVTHAEPDTTTMNLMPNAMPGHATFEHGQHVEQDGSALYLSAHGASTNVHAVPQLHVQADTNSMNLMPHSHNPHAAVSDFHTPSESASSTPILDAIHTQANDTHHVSLAAPEHSDTHINDVDVGHMP